MKTGASQVTFNEEKRQVQPNSGSNIFEKSLNPNINLVIANKTNTVTTNIKYYDAATIGFDTGFDIGNFNGASLDVFTFLVDNSNQIKYTIQSLPNTNKDDDTSILLGINAKAGETIAITAKTKNLPNDINLYLEDKNTNTFTKINQNNAYSFTPIHNLTGKKGRFYLHKTRATLNNEQIALNEIKIYKTTDKNLRISGLKNNQTVYLKLFDLLGKQLLQTDFVAKGTKNILLHNLKTGVYIVSLKTEEGTLNKKIIMY